jgi:hypothetical protein
MPCRRRALRRAEGELAFLSSEIIKHQDEKQQPNSTNFIKGVLQLLIRLAVVLLVLALAPLIIKISVEDSAAILSVTGVVLSFEIYLEATGKNRHLRVIIELKPTLLDSWRAIASLIVLIVKTIASVLVTLFISHFPLNLPVIAFIWSAPIVVPHSLHRRRRALR